MCRRVDIRCFNCRRSYRSRISRKLVLTCKNHLNEFFFVRFEICQQTNFFEQIRAQPLRLVDDEDGDFVFLVHLHKELMQLCQDRILCAPLDINAKIRNTGAEKLCRSSALDSLRH